MEALFQEAADIITDVQLLRQSVPEGCARTLSAFLTKLESVDGFARKIFDPMVTDADRPTRHCAFELVQLMKTCLAIDDPVFNVAFRKHRNTILRDIYHQYGEGEYFKDFETKVFEESTDHP